MADFGESTAQNIRDSVTTVRNAESTNTEAINAIRPSASGNLTGGGAAGEGRLTRLLSGEGDGAAVPGQSGGTIRPRFDGTIRSYELDEKWASDTYESIRGSDDAGEIAGNVRDVSRLDGSSGFTTGEIQTIKNHVFSNEHPLAGIDGGVVSSRFDPNSDMAEAWLRLRAGTFKPQDVTLLEHELAENRYWQQHPDAVYPEAHSAANQVANWERDIPEPGRGDSSKPWR